LIASCAALGRSAALTAAVRAIGIDPGVSCGTAPATAARTVVSFDETTACARV
jgi:hypothetical protein